MIKKIFISILLSTNLLFSSGIPTVDVGAILQTIISRADSLAHYSELAIRWKSTLTQYKNELKAFENDLLSKTGTRDSVKFLKDLKRAQEYADTFGEDFLSLDITQDSKSKLAKLKKELYNKYKIFDRCKEIPLLEWQKDACMKEVDRNVKELATVKAYNEKFQEDNKELEELSKRAANSKDTKESQDIANAINLKMIEIQRRDQYLQMSFRQNEAEKRTLEEQYHQDYLSKLGKAPKYEIPSDWK